MPRHVCVPESNPKRKDKRLPINGKARFATVPELVCFEQHLLYTYLPIFQLLGIPEFSLVPEWIAISNPWAVDAFDTPDVEVQKFENTELECRDTTTNLSTAIRSHTC